MCDSWVAYFRTQSRNLHRFYGRAQESWDQVDEYDSQKLHSVMLTSEKIKVHRLVKKQVKLPHLRSPYAVKFEDRSREETERQERCARGDACRLAKSIFKLKETDKTTFFSPTNEWSSPASSTIKPEEREFVVDSGASMHMLSRKDLTSAELETVKVSTNPTTVVTANGEVLTKEEATVYVRESDSFVTVMLLEDTPAVLSLGKLCEDHGLPLDQWSGHHNSSKVADG